MNSSNRFSPTYLNAKARRNSRIKIDKVFRRGAAGDALWKGLFPQTLASLPENRKRDILDKNSLTQRLIRKSQGEFEVQIVSQGFQRPEFSEWRRLGLKNRQLALLRSVKLCGKGEVWVLARSVIPLSTLRGKTRYLASLGTKPLGAVLFRDPSLGRAMFEICEVHLAQLPKFQPLPESTKGWGRRSVFLLHNKPLLVAEIFLENCPVLSD